MDLNLIHMSYIVKWYVIQAIYICYALIIFIQSEALRNQTGKPIFFNSCEWGVDKPWEWMYQYANSWRTGPDHHDDWTSTAAIIEGNAELGDYAGM